MNRGLRVVILSRSSRPSDTDSSNGIAYGLDKDAKLIEQTLRETNASGIRIDTIDYIDPVSFYGNPNKPAQVVDVQIHLEVPCRAAWRWAKVNIVVVNPEWWPSKAWDWALKPVEQGGANIIVFKSEAARALFPEIEGKRCRIVPWRSSASVPSLDRTASGRREFLYLIGGSVNKLAAAKIICAGWKASWPPVRIVGSDGVLSALRGLVTEEDANKRGIVFQTSYPDDKSRITAQANYAYHIVASAAEGYGFTFAEAAALGAIPLWTDIPVYNEVWGETVGNVGKIVTSIESVNTYRDPIRTFSMEALELAVESILGLSADEEVHIRGKLRRVSADHTKEFRHAWRVMLTNVSTRQKGFDTPRLPPASIKTGDLPHVAIITVTRDRPRWFGNMARNIIMSDYPADKMTWIVADDGDPVKGGMLDGHVAKFQEKNPRFSVKYIPISKPKTIGEKRNLACQAAPPEASVFVMMDDDDHYPSSSLAKRVAWLQEGKRNGIECVYCSTLPVYDCTRYISAVNVPPLTLAPCERVSEATLCFSRAFWEAGRFPAVGMAEGEGFLASRDHQTNEIDPQGIIVSFVHGKNTTSRRIPKESEPNGCHYGFDDTYFTYISELGLSS